MYRWLCVVMIIKLVWAIIPPSTPPMLIWGLDTHPPQTIFKYMKTFDLVRMLKPIHKDYMIVVYLATELTAKDINCPSCYRMMSQILPLDASLLDATIATSTRPSRRSPELLSVVDIPARLACAIATTKIRMSSSLAM
uniref:Secreted protein n=1 Tax=Drosophila pseudoobscura pseudoobscura TaxID=46245 RepID=B5DUA2_DROPS